MRKFNLHFIKAHSTVRHSQSADTKEMPFVPAATVQMMLPYPAVGRWQAGLCCAGKTGDKMINLSYITSKNKQWIGLIGVRHCQSQRNRFKTSNFKVSWNPIRKLPVTSAWKLIRSRSRVSLTLLLSVTICLKIISVLGCWASFFFLFFLQLLFGDLFFFPIVSLKSPGTTGKSASSFL